MNTSPTPRQAAALRALARLTEERGIPPSIREMCDELEIRSTNGVTEHLRALERKGFVRCVAPRTARSWVLTDQGKEAL